MPAPITTTGALLGTVLNSTLRKTEGCVLRFDASLCRTISHNAGAVLWPARWPATGRGRSCGQLLPVPASHWVTSSGCASRNFFAASSSLSLSTAIDFATRFWSSFVQVKFLITVYAGLPELANLV